MQALIDIDNINLRLRILRSILTRHSESCLLQLTGCIKWLQMRFPKRGNFDLAHGTSAEMEMSRLNGLPPLSCPKTPKSTKTVTPFLVGRFILALIKDVVPAE